jgi:hypothetical protein
MVQVTFNRCITNITFTIKPKTSTIKLILRSHINAFNTARGLVGLDPDKNATLL